MLRTLVSLPRSIAGMRFAVRCLPLAAGVLLMTGGQIGQQDVVGYMLAQANGPRYLARIVAAPYGETIAPTFVYSAGADEAEPRHAPELAVAGVGDFEVLGLAEATVEPEPEGETAALSSRAAGKGDLLADVRPTLDAREIGSGSVATAVSLLTPGTVKDFPRVSFVRPTSFDGAAGARSLVASIGKTDTGEPTAETKVDEARFMAAASAATSASLANAYAAETGLDLNAPFEALLGGSQGTAKAPGPLDHWWSDRPLPVEITEERQVHCLAEAIYFEARSESRLGQMAVAQVVINRVKNPAYPDTICGVVYQNKRWYNRCQFSFACDRIRDVVRDSAAWSQAMEIAEGYTSQKMWLSEIGASTHYHATYVNPKWAPHMKRLERIGHHIFYLTVGGDWT